ncbi:MAG TPA: hypothetical protein VGQ02_11530 [Candidatus Limnocylindrales bacterium]|nr:hypothetical protein [Candidatus Limnocylindrales bacterium]
MDDRSEQVTRLGPDSGGRPSGTPTPRVYTWEWGPDQARRPGMPWIGIFLLVFGGLLLLQQLYPEAQSVGSVLVLAIGIAFLVRWALTRGTGSLYVGAIITALAVPSALTNAGLGREGLGTLALGVAFLFIALIRATSGGGVGWQAWFGGLLAVIGGVNLVQPQVGGLLVPVALVVIGVLLVFGGGLHFDPRRRA